MLYDHLQGGDISDVKNSEIFIRLPTSEFLDLYRCFTDFENMVGLSTDNCDHRRHCRTHKSLSMAIPKSLVNPTA